MSDDETIGELHDRLPDGEWVALPEYGVRVKRFPDPSTETWRAALGQSTSKQLRETQAALAASQADLTAMQAKHDALTLLNAELKAEATEMRSQAEHWLTKLREAAQDLARETHCLAQERTRREWWQDAAKAAGVAGGCFRCGGPILPGQDVEPQTDTTKGSYAHVACPDPQENP